VAGIWLGMLGEWKPVVLGIVAAVVMPYGFALVALPQAFVAAGAVKMWEKGQRILGQLMAMLAWGWGGLGLGVWVWVVFSRAVEYAEQIHAVPVMLLGYAVTMSPLVYMMAHEATGEDSGSAAGVLFAQVGYVIFLIVWLFGGSMATGTWVVAGLGVFWAVGMGLVASALMKELRIGQIADNEGDWQWE